MAPRRRERQGDPNLGGHQSHVARPPQSEPVIARWAPLGSQPDVNRRDFLKLGAIAAATPRDPRPCLSVGGRGLSGGAGNAIARRRAGRPWSVAASSPSPLRVSEMRGMVLDRPRVSRTGPKTSSPASGTGSRQLVLARKKPPSAADSRRPPIGGVVSFGTMSRAAQRSPAMVVREIVTPQTRALRQVAKMVPPGGPMRDIVVTRRCRTDQESAEHRPRQCIALAPEVVIGCGPRK